MRERATGGRRSLQGPPNGQLLRRPGDDGARAGVCRRSGWIERDGAAAQFVIFRELPYNVRYAQAQCVDGGWRLARIERRLLRRCSGRRRDSARLRLDYRHFLRGVLGASCRAEQDREQQKPVGEAHGPVERQNDPEREAENILSPIQGDGVPLAAGSGVVVLGVFSMTGVGADSLGFTGGSVSIQVVTSAKTSSRMASYIKR